MAAAVRVATLPFRALFRLIKLLFLPVGMGALTLWIGLSGWSWALWATAVMAVWAWVMTRLWWTQVRGELRSLARGTVDVHRSGSASSSRRGGRR